MTMKLTNVIALVSLAAGLAMPLSAQQPAQPLSLNMYGLLKKGGKSVTGYRLYPPANVAKNVIVVSQLPSKQNPEPEAREMSAKDFKVLVVQSPADLVAATRAYNAGNLAEARPLLRAVRDKYAGFVGLPSNPSLKAARMELDCLVRLMDWKGVESLIESTPGKQFLEPEDRIVQEAARLLSQVSDDAATAAARQKDIEAFLADSKSRNINSEVYGWMKYALGRALASNFSEAELQNGIDASKADMAALAVDAYCESFASYHLRSKEIPVDALTRAFNLLWAMPGVKSYALSNKSMTEEKWNTAPANFRDAATIAYLLENVFAPGIKDASVRRAAALYYNPQQGKKA